jgi:hypothetical protein
MRWIICIIALFMFLAWDIAANNGHYTHLISGEIDDLGRELHLW